MRRSGFSGSGLASKLNMFVFGYWLCANRRQAFQDVGAAFSREKLLG